MPREESPAPGRSSLITSAPMSPRIMVQKGPAMCSVMSRTFTPSSGPFAFVSAMVGRVSGRRARVGPGEVARVPEHVGHRDLVEDERERADHAARRADAAGEERLVRGLDRL